RRLHLPLPRSAPATSKVPLIAARAAAVGKPRGGTLDVCAQKMRRGNGGLWDDSARNASEDRGAVSMHCPVTSGKRDKHSLEKVLGRAMAFVAQHLGCGRRVLVHCEDGLQQSVCVVVAILTCHFDILGTAFAPSPSPPQPLSKEDLRQRLRIVSMHHPQARPTRSMLRQIFNYCRGLAEGAGVACKRL
ncbi:hypothetical protein CYMTET_23262, partial [Cymbomonas tetramitiformis]